VLAQHARFVELLEAEGAAVEWLEVADDDDLSDSVFTYDPTFVLPGGAVLLNPGKPLRVGEVALHERFYDVAGIPILGRIEAPGTFEGGDAFFLDSSTIAVGRGFRTDQAGIEQFRAIVGALGIEVLAYDLPYHAGPDACLHLMSVVSVLDERLALVHLPLLPTALFQEMLDRGYELLPAPPAEFEASLGLNLNVLATAPRRCLAVEGFPLTHELMRSAGCEVVTFAGDELCIPCEGGPTCLTRPLLRR
jgi:N-dimethylarginine dimethylaminohydrolase